MKKWLEVKFNTLHKAKPHIELPHSQDPMSNTIDISDSGIHSNKQQIPGVLAQLILEQEFICEQGNIDHTQLAKLTSLYSQAVEYFEGQGNQKYKLYQKRMEQFLQKGTIDEFLRGHSVNLARRRDKAELEIRESRIKSFGQVNRLMLEIDKKIDKNRHLVNRNIADQESSLFQRMRKRTTRSTTTSKTRAEDEELESPYPKSSAFSEQSSFSIDLEHYLKRAF